MHQNCPKKEWVNTYMEEIVRKEAFAHFENKLGSLKL